jgi:hypothetical protein
MHLAIFLHSDCGIGSCPVLNLNVGVPHKHSSFLKLGKILLLL